LNNCRPTSSLFVVPWRWIVWILVLHVIVSQVALAQTDAEHSGWSVKQLVEFHQHHHPQLKVQDVFKLFYQAAFGVEHILSDSSEVASYLMGELASLDTTASDEPLLEQISMEGDVVRVNLRPFKVLNLDPSLLVKVMFQSARETIPDTTVFNGMWNEFSALVRSGFLEYPSDDIKAWDTRIVDGNIPPLHHSREYSETNKPAYRVVRRKIFFRIFGKITR
jgi:hypothetical protein